MQYLLSIIKSIVLAICMLYAVNLIIVNAGIVIPINYYSIIFVSIFGFPALVGLIIIKKLI